MRRAFLYTLALLFAPSLVHAQVVITEIMYDLAEGGDTDREWIEVMNSGSESVNLTEWKFFESSSNHGITAVSGGETLAPGSYAVIVDNPEKFKADWPSYTGPLFDSAFALSNTGETLVMRCCLSGQGGNELTDKDSASYSAEMGAAGDGNSLHRASGGGNLTPGAPSPGSGQIPPALSPPPETSSSNTPSSNSPNSSGGTSVGSKSSGLAVSAGADAVVFVGTSFALSAKVTESGKTLETSDVFWNFGDGKTGQGQATSHSWAYAGKYVVSVRVMHGGESATDSLTLEVIEPQLSVSVHDDGSVAIGNRAGRDADLSGWRVSDRGKTFSLPPGTIVLRGAVLRLAPDAIGFLATESTEFQYPNGKIFVTHDERIAVVNSSVVTAPVSVTPTTELKVDTNTQTSKRTSSKSVKSDVVEEGYAREVVVEDEKKKDGGVEALTQVAATPVSSGDSNVFMWWGSAGALAALAGAAVYAARRVREHEWEIIDDSDNLG